MIVFQYKYDCKKFVQDCKSLETIDLNKLLSWEYFYVMHIILL